MFKSLLIRFKRDKAGVASIEFVMIAPIMLLMFLGGLTLFGMFRAYDRVVQSSGIVADLVTRQNAIGDRVFEDLYNISVNLQADKAMPHALRLSSVIFVDDKYKVVWSKEAGDTALLPAQSLDMKTLPEIPDGDSVIYVESAVKHSTLSSILGFADVRFSQSVSARPRFVAAIAYE